MRGDWRWPEATRLTCESDTPKRRAIFCSTPHWYGRYASLGFAVGGEEVTEDIICCGKVARKVGGCETLRI